MSCHLIYHPKRCVQDFGGTKVHFDRPGGNQDPYVWNHRFLHSYCHITELTAPAAGDVNIWVSGDTFPNFNILACDLVFVVEQKIEWKERNSIAADDPLVDSSFAYEDHYRWAHQHPFKKRNRITLKAEAAKSFQTQDAAGDLIDILPELNLLGFKTSMLRSSLRKGFASKPLPVSSQCASDLVKCLHARAAIKLTDAQLQSIREVTPPRRFPARGPK